LHVLAAANGWKPMMQATTPIEPAAIGEHEKANPEG
jgi:hypothetical protein